MDLRGDDATLAEAIAPRRIPAGQWPAPKAYPLVTLQQCAVNFAAASGEARLVPVNGPPGTGKTTLLRDLIASVVVDRARVMCGFDQPSRAFSPTSLKAKLGKAFLLNYSIDQRLKGFELVVASTNNKAVENVSAELPALTSIDETRTNLRYFKHVADNVARRSRDASPASQWGLVAAVLGNSKNRYAFRQAAWSDEDHGLRAYLLEASGHPQTVEVKDPKTGRIVETRPPSVVTAEKPPKDDQTALRRWKTTRRRFIIAVKLVDERLAVLQKGHDAVRQGDLTADVQTALGQVQQIASKLRRLDADRDVQQARGARLRAERQRLESVLAAHDRNRPGVISRLLASAQQAGWQQQRSHLLQQQESNVAELQDVGAVLASLAAAEDDAKRELTAAKLSAAAIEARAQAARTDIEKAAAICGPRFVDAAFLEREPRDLHRDTPWLDDETLRLRAEVFEAAIAVHRAFVDAAAKEIRNNLDLLFFKAFFGRSAWSAKMRPAMSDLWATFFCVVPVISTAFASVDRMLGYLEPGTLGLLLVDEAGQAAPQAAVGALLRAKRAVVGDPKQLPPVTTLPTDLADRIAAEFRVDRQRFVAPEATVQSLADASSTYGTMIDGNGGGEWVGVPLVVHRRCAEPMFSLANRLAYGGTMVLGRPARSSTIREILGPSAWIDVKPARCEDKWSEAEGQAAVSLLRRLEQAGLQDPDVFLITPFRIVAQRLRQALLHSRILSGWTPSPSSWVQDRVGTVYTVQGREADTVIMVLGAAEPQRRGARSWAGEPVNQLNVAVTRAKENLYVIGNRFEWASAGKFASLERALP